MRKFLIATALVASVAIAQEDPFISGPVLQAEIAKNCKEGCITFNREEAEALAAEFDRILVRKQKEAFAAGMAAQKQACASLI